MPSPVPLALPVKLVADLPMAWKHHCGHLNPGLWQRDTICGGCNTNSRSDEVEARYLLVELEI